MVVCVFTRITLHLEWVSRYVTEETFQSDTAGNSVHDANVLQFSSSR